jgi:hypothetical protein
MSVIYAVLGPVRCEREIVVQGSFSCGIQNFRALLEEIPRNVRQVRYNVFAAKPGETVALMGTGEGFE